MVRYLSSAWFDRIREAERGSAPADGAVGTLAALGTLEGRGGIAGPASPPPIVLRHVVEPGPGVGAADRTGEADYDVVIVAGRAVIRHPVSGPADLTFTSDYPTAAAVAAGRLSTHAALAEGRLRVAGDVGILSRRAAEVTGLDPVPADLRAETEF